MADVYAAETPSLTSFNPFSEEDEHDQSSYALVTSIFSRVRHSLTHQRSGPHPANQATATHTTPTSPGQTQATAALAAINSSSPRAVDSSPYNALLHTSNSGSNLAALANQAVPRGAAIAPPPTRPQHLARVSNNKRVAPPLVSLTPATFEAPSYYDLSPSPSPWTNMPDEEERPGSRTGFFYSPTADAPYGTSIPGFPMNAIDRDDAKSIRTSYSGNIPATRAKPAVSKVIRKIRGEGLSKDYWMSDESCTDCYDCRSVFTAWRRKHHCRICGQIFCARCASNIIKGTRFGSDSMIRVCNLCLEKIDGEDDDDDDRRSVYSSYSGFAAHQNPYLHSQLREEWTRDNLQSIAERGRRRLTSFSSLDANDDREGSVIGSRPLTPGAFDADLWDEMQASGGLSAPGTAGKASLLRAPFRRHILEESEGVGGIKSADGRIPFPTTPDDSPNTVPISVEGPSVINSTASLADSGTLPPPTRPPLVGEKSSIQFPGVSQSPERHLSFSLPGGEKSANGSPKRLSMMRSRVNSWMNDLGMREGPGEVGSVPFLRNRVQSRMSDFGMPDGMEGWRTRRESTYAQELNALSMFHLRMMIRQMLTTEEIPNVEEWEETLFRLSLQIARALSLDAAPLMPPSKDKDKDASASSAANVPDMDVRRLIKIKKIPGGKPSDSEFVDGAVITKNVAHKAMARSQRNMRVMVVSFPLDFQRVEGKYVAFGQILTQESEYIENLAARIAGFRPHLVLAEKGVSRLALEKMVSAGIAVARNVKPSATAFVAKMTQGDIITGMDRLASEPRLGHCTQWRIQTFDHPLIPGRRKTYMRFEGCPRFGSGGGGTIVLRGGREEVLRKVKRVCRFALFVVRNLKMETSLWKDELITLPILTGDAVPIPGPVRARRRNSSTFLERLGDRWHEHSYQDIAQEASLRGNESAISDSDDDTPGVIPTERSTESAKLSQGTETQELSKRIQESLEPYERTFISVSATLRFDPPQPIRQMKEADDRLREARRHCEEKELAKHEKDVTVTSQTADTTKSQASLIAGAPSTPASPSLLDTVRTVPVSSGEDYFNSTPKLRNSTSSTPLVEDLTPMVPPPSNSNETVKVENPEIAPQELTGSSKLSVKSKRDSMSSFFDPSSLTGSHDLHAVKGLKQPADIVVESQLSLTQLQHDEQRRVWEWYLRKNNDDFVVDKYQNIFVREYTAPTTPNGVGRACFQPKVVQITFYGENDCTLGQYIDRVVMEGKAHLREPKPLCTGNSCNKPLLSHSQIYVHNESSISICVKESSGTTRPDIICTWSVCRICEAEAPCLPISEEMQRYSFAKFLELYFYPADVTLIPELKCGHNVYSMHKRFVSYKGMTITIQSDHISLHDIVFPPIRIRVCPESLLQLKNIDYERLLVKNFVWYSSLIDELQFVMMDCSTGDEKSDQSLLQDVNQLILRAENERNEIATMVHKVYSDSHPTDTLALNAVRRYRQDRMVAWQQDFDRLPKPRPPAVTEKEKRPTTTFGTVRNMFPKRSELLNLFETPNRDSRESDTESFTFRGRRIVSEPGASASESESATDSAQMKSAKPATKLPEEEKEEEKEIEVTGLAAEVAELPPVEESTRSEGEDSDDTIGASKASLRRESGTDLDESTPGPLQPLELNPVEGDLNERATPTSRLPRPLDTPLKVADLIKRWQNSDSVDDLGEADSELGPGANQDTFRIKSRKRADTDYERGYAHNIAPKYISNTRRGGSRIPGPVSSHSNSQESRDSSRQASPDKRSFSLGKPPTPSTIRAPKVKATLRHASRDKSSLRQPTTPIRPIPLSRRKMSAAQGKVNTIARNFDRLAKAADKQNRRFSVIRGRKPRPVASAKPKQVVNFPNVREAIRDESDSDDASEADDEEDDRGEEEPSTTGVDQDLEQSLGSMVDSTTSVSTAQDSTAPTSSSDSLKSPIEAAPLSPPITIPDVMLPTPTPLPTGLDVIHSISSDQAAPSSDFELPASYNDKNYFTRALSKFFPTGISNLQALNRALTNDFDTEDAFADPEHIFRESDIVVRTDEPTSMIALTLDSPKYREDLAKARSERRAPRVSDAAEAFMPDDSMITDSGSNWGVVQMEKVEEVSTDPVPLPSVSRSPIQYTFESSGITITCTVLFAEQFDTLRRDYDCHESMIESLARCVKWDNRGGKSGSAFLKTRDDRFIAKELSKAELNAMETFAPAYFEYMASARTAERPTLLAKIFGCYKIAFKQEKEGSAKVKTHRMNLLVMENLFYDRRFSRIYDLKGSTRNRHVQSTGRENEVLLDENLVQVQHLTPFFLREHSKRILRGALWNDSKFLADLNVMDYSLVVGVDTQKNELVVGIVDYIRTYTWDKKLESWVKESTFLGGHGKGEPTIVTPKQYKARFRSAMERYFPLAPDRWMKQRDFPDEEGDSLLDLWPDW